MQLCKYYPVANDRMGIIWTLSSIEGACVIEFGPAGTTHYAVEGVGSLNGNDKAKIYSTHMDQSDVTFGKYDRIEKAVIFRKGKKTDYLQLDKEGHHKQFNKLCRDEKISAREREKQWVIADGDHIIWFPGVRMSECYKITDQTEHILEITIKSDKV